jgi:uncharacterized membrane protein YciS (DUF1049 family)
MKSVKTFVIGLVIVVLVLGLVQNVEVLTHQESLKLNLLVVSLTTPPIAVSLLLAGAFVIGFLVAWILGYMTQRRLKHTISGLRLHQKRMEEELASLRNLAVTEPGNVPTHAAAAGDEV